MEAEGHSSKQMFDSVRGNKGHSCCSEHAFYGSLQVHFERKEVDFPMEGSSIHIFGNEEDVEDDSYIEVTQFFF